MIEISQNQNLITELVAIKVLNLIKIFGSLVAVNDVSFEINQGYSTLENLPISSLLSIFNTLSSNSSGICLKEKSSNSGKRF